MKEVLKLALEALELCDGAETVDGVVIYTHKAIAAIKEALAQLEQSNMCGEPDWKGLVLSHNEDCESRCDMDRCGYKPYYEYSKRRCPDCPVHEKIWVDDTTPPHRKPLTDDELADLWYKQSIDWLEFARAIEAAHGIKE